MCRRCHNKKTVKKHADQSTGLWPKNRHRESSPRVGGNLQEQQIGWTWPSTDERLKCIQLKKSETELWDVEVLWPRFFCFRFNIYIVIAPLIVAGTTEVFIAEGTTGYVVLWCLSDVSDQVT